MCNFIKYNKRHVCAWISNVQQEITIARDMVIHWYYEKLPTTNDHYEQEMARLMHKAIDDNLRKVFYTNF
jgi:glutamyl-tRNA reductase